MKKNSFIVFGILVITLSVLLVGCTGNTESKEKTLPETEVSTTQALPEYATETSTTEEPETEAPKTTKTQNSGAGNTYKPTEAPKPAPKPTEAPTKAPETTKKQETKPTQVPTKAPETTKKPQSSSSSKDEPPTFANGTVDFGAVREEVEEEMGGIVYF